MKFSGKVGFWMDDVETSPGVFKSAIVEKPYYGDVVKNIRRWQEGEQQNDKLKVNNSISILSDLFAQQNYASIKYVLWNGAKLKVTQVTLDYPRITMELGGVYNDENAAGTS